jgi:hypothetical protein
MRLLMSIASVLVLAVGVNGCSDSIGPQSIVGLWVEDGPSLPGNSLVMHLSLNGSTISGQGVKCGEALSCESTSTTGTVTGNTFHLVTTFDNGVIETFDGTLTSSNSLSGTARDAVPGSEIQLPHAQSFHRSTDDPPRTQ